MNFRNIVVVPPPSSGMGPWLVGFVVLLFVAGGLLAIVAVRGAKYRALTAGTLLLLGSAFATQAVTLPGEVWCAVVIGSMLVLGALSFRSDEQRSKTECTASRG